MFGYMLGMTPRVGVRNVSVVPKSQVLVVDDDAEIRNTLAELLDAEGYDVRQAEDGFVALRLVEERRPALILLDLTMPAMSGWEVLERLHAHPEHRTIPVVVISAESTPPPDVTFVSKPFLVERLLETVRRKGLPLAAGDRVGEAVAELGLEARHESGS